MHLLHGGLRGLGEASLVLQVNIALDRAKPQSRTGRACPLASGMLLPPFMSLLRKRQLTALVVFAVS